ncbi:MAG: apolipoprotein N-acyltransferase [Colwellia sp.]
MTKLSFQHCYARLKTKLFNKKIWLCFISGLSLVFAYAPFSQWWLTLTIPIVFLSVINNTSPKQAFGYSLFFAFGWFASGISWVHVSIDQFGGLPLVISLLLMLLLCLYLAFFPALAAYLTARLSTNKQFNLWLLPPLWLFCEYLRSVVLTGFPWLSLGYSQIDSPLAFFAPVIGEVGLTTLVLFINIALYQLFSPFFINSATSNKQQYFSLFFLIGISILTSVLSQQSWTKFTDKKVKLALIQGNIAQSLKWSPEQEWPTMLKYLDLTRVNYDADIIVWPESAVPVLEPTAQDYLTMVNQSALLNESSIITGIQNYNFETKKYFNGLVVLGKKNKNDEHGYYYNSSNRYYKHHLLPIGEFVPFQSIMRPIAPLFNLPMSSFSEGNYVQPNIMANGFAVLPLICFEIAFPKQLAANITPRTDLILTVSNDAWFGDSHGPHQHLEIARMRALEFGKPVMRSTNNGITAVIDHLGNVVASIPQFEEAVLKTELNLVTGQTPYSQWSNLILWLLIFIPLLVVKCSNKYFIAQSPYKNSLK